MMSTGLNAIWTPLYYVRWKKIIMDSFNNIDGFITVSKALHDTLFRSTLLNIFRYMARRDLGLRVLTRLTRRSY